MKITSAKKQGDGHRVTWEDGTISSVPPGHRFNAAIDEFVADGGTVEPEFTAAEIDEQERRERARARREELRVEVAGSLPPDSAPALADRIAKLEIILGLREPDV